MFGSPAFSCQHLSVSYTAMHGGAQFRVFYRYVPVEIAVLPKITGSTGRVSVQLHKIAFFSVFVFALRQIANSSKQFRSRKFVYAKSSKRKSKNRVANANWPASTRQRKLLWQIKKKTEIFDTDFFDHFKNYFSQGIRPQSFSKGLAQKPYWASYSNH